jgi:NAD(P)H-hydrate epimerase
MQIVRVSEMRALEQAAVDAGDAWDALMERAGSGVARCVLRAIAPAQDRRALVLVGPGNNGGDGLVIARRLHDAGVAATLYLWRARSESDANYTACVARGIGVHLAEEDADLAALHTLLAASDLAIDALLGIGVSRPLTGHLAAIVAAVNGARATHRLRVFAVDIPSGIDADTGAVQGAAITADTTISTGPPKRGMLLYPGAAYAGALHVADIGLPAAALEKIMSELITAELARTLLPARPSDAHKGTFGHVLVVAGSPHYPGAAGLASAAAARAGAGLVTLASGRSTLVVGRIPEVIAKPLPEAEWGALGEAAADEIRKDAGNYAAILIGPGLGREKATQLFLERLIGIEAARQRIQIGFRIGAAPEKPAPAAAPLPPLVIDADALNLLAAIAESREGEEDHWWDRLERGTCVLTPHPGEMRRLLGVESLDDDLVAVAEQAAARWGQVVVLKGATTIVAGPDGRTLVNRGDNPALATGGTGDVLAGVIAGLLAQGRTPFDAAALGVYLHSAAGALVRAEIGDMGALASDLLPRLPLAAKRLKSGEGD